MSKSTREIVTLQLGHYANFVGTHWWNIQESSFVYNPNEVKGSIEVDHDVMFREGQNLNGQVTYTPRLVAVDLKGSLNTLKQDGVLYDCIDEEEYSCGNWASDVTMHKVDVGSKNEFLKDLEKEEAAVRAGDTEKSDDEMESEQDAPSKEKIAIPQADGPKLYNLDESVHVWSDYLRMHLHPKTLQIVNQYSTSDSAVPFDVFGYGEEVYNNHSFKSSLEDKLHFFLEECDNLQGLHLLVDTYDGFSGLASSALEDLGDEYGNKGLMVFGVSPPVFPGSTTHQGVCRLLNSVLGYERLAGLGSLFLPLSLTQSLGRKPGPSVLFPHLQYNPDLPYHSSAVLAASLDSASLPYRLDGDPSLMTHLTASMTPSGRKVLALHSSLPFPLHPGQTLVDTLLDHGDRVPWCPLTPMCGTDTSPQAQSVVLRGIPTSRLKGAPSPRIPQQLNKCDTFEEVLNIYLRETCQTSLSAICCVRQPCKVTDPFPHVFSPQVNCQGEVTQAERPTTIGVESIPMMTSLQSTNSAGGLLTSLHEQASKINIRKFYKFVEAGLEEDDYSERLDSLLALAQCYDRDRESDSDDDS